MWLQPFAILYPRALAHEPEKREAVFRKNDSQNI
jgi:hypothetical protein